MLSLTAPIKTRLQALPALTGWAVRTGTESADRSVVPVADVRCTGAGVSDRKTGAVLVAPEWTLQLVVRRSDVAAEQLDTAIAAVIETLHGWAPGRLGGRGWERLALTNISEPAFVDEGYAGYQLTFGTAATYMGQQ